MYELAFCPPLNFANPTSVILQTHRLSITHLEDRRSPWQPIELLCKKHIPCKKSPTRHDIKHRKEGFSKDKHAYRFTEMNGCLYSKRKLVPKRGDPFHIELFTIL